MESAAKAMQVFNNWNIVAKGWYAAARSHDVAIGAARSVNLCGQRLVLFRGTDGRVRALDAYCPHMGTDLGIGRVEGNWIRCFFHHWAFDETGTCRDIPCQQTIPTKAAVPAYATEEKYGLIWVYPEATAPSGVAEFDELRGKELLVQLDRPFERPCHHHICMMNGIDAQHLHTVHKLDIAMDLTLQHDASGRQIDFTMRGTFPSTTWRERLGQKILGDSYEYSMRYADGCLGLLTIMKNVRLVPPLHMIYAYTPLAPGKTQIQPIYVAARRPGLMGYLVTCLLLLATRLAYYLLRDEDGMVYDHIQFSPKTLLEIDVPIVTYMSYVNRLEPSRWSTQLSTDPATATPAPLADSANLHRSPP